MVDRNCQCCGRYCRNYRLWLTIQNGIYKVVADIVFELFISFCILMNVTGMAIEHYQMDKVLEETLGVFNIVSITVSIVTFCFIDTTFSTFSFTAGYIPIQNIRNGTITSTSSFLLSGESPVMVHYFMVLS